MEQKETAQLVRISLSYPETDESATVPEVSSSTEVIIAFIAMAMELSEKYDV